MLEIENFVRTFVKYPGKAQCIENSMMVIYLREKLSVEEVFYFGLPMMVSMILVL